MNNEIPAPKYIVRSGNGGIYAVLKRYEYGGQFAYRDYITCLDQFDAQSVARKLNKADSDD